MKSIIFIDTNKSGSSREAIKAAERLGYYTILFTNRTNVKKQRTEYPDIHLVHICNLENISEMEQTIRNIQLRGIKICAIISFVDPYCHLACLLADKLEINSFSTEAIANMEDKILSRQVLEGSQYSPHFICLTEDTPYPKDEIEKYLPLIMKSPHSTGSKDVFKINTYDDFVHYRKLLFNKYPLVPILAEEFLDGPQFLVETMMCEGNLNIIAIIKQEITFYKRFIITGYNLMIDLPNKFQNKLKSAVEEIIQMHGMVNGTCHLEMRLVNDQWKLIEINPRISGGGMNSLLEISYGINVVEQTLKLALGEKVYISPKYKNYTFSQYVTVSKSGILEKVTGRNRASKCLGVKAVYIKPRKGALLTQPLSMGNRYAYVIATGDSEKEARQNAKNAANQIKFWLLPAKE